MFAYKRLKSPTKDPEWPKMAYKRPEKIYKKAINIWLFSATQLAKFDEILNSPTQGSADI